MTRTLCAEKGCHVWVLSDGHHHCEHLTLYPAAFHPYYHLACFPRHATVVALLPLRSLIWTVLGSCPLAHLVQLACTHRRAALWEDFVLPRMLRFGWTSCLSPSPCFPHLFCDHQQPKLPFFVFPPDPDRFSHFAPPSVGSVFVSVTSHYPASAPQPSESLPP